MGSAITTRQGCPASTRRVGTSTVSEDEAGSFYRWLSGHVTIAVFSDTYCQIQALRDRWDRAGLLLNVMF